MSRPLSAVCSETSLALKGTSLGDLLTVRPSGLEETEAWAILCQSIQALQDLFLSDGVSGKQCIPLVTPGTLKLSSKGRVKLHLTDSFVGFGPPIHLAGYLAPEYKAQRNYSDTEYEKMWIFSLGETLKRATVTSHAATSRLSKDLCRVLSDMTRLQESPRASLMSLLDVMSDYCKKRQQNRPFSHIVMDLHQEALAGIEASADILWGPPAMPQIVPRSKTISESSDKFSTIQRRWHFSKLNADPKITKEVATSMEDLSILTLTNTPGRVVRPKSMCVPDSRYIQQDDTFFNDRRPNLDLNKDFNFGCGDFMTLEGLETNHQATGARSKRLRVRRNPVQRAASRLYRVGMDLPANKSGHVDNCVGPEFVVRGSLPSKHLVMANSKGSKKPVVIILLDGQKLEVICSASSLTGGQLLEFIIQEEHIEENFMLGLSALIAGDFVFIPSDTRICKVLQSGTTSSENLTLYLRVRFFLPSLRGIRGNQARHFLYLQLRRSILEHQLPSSFSQIIELNGLALQAEFGDYDDMEHGSRDYFLLEHYVPETMTCIIDDEKRLQKELMTAHISKKGLGREKAEQDFIIFAQNFPHYGGHFYTAIWMLKDNNKQEIWLYISAQGINLYERGKTTSHFGPKLYESFEWKSIQTLCYTKHYLCILPHNSLHARTKFKKYKLKMDHKKSYFAFRLASLHHQFFLRLRTEYTSMQSLSQQFGIPLKDIKNETNSLCKLDTYNQPMFSEAYCQDGTVNAQTEFKVEFKPSTSRAAFAKSLLKNYRKTKSVQDLTKVVDQSIDEDYQNKENEKPGPMYQHGLVLDSSYFADLPIGSEKRRGVKMGTRAYSKSATRSSRSMEAVNDSEYLEQISLESMSFHCSSTSMSRTSLDGLQPSIGDAYVLDSTLKSVSQLNILPNFQETINETLLERLNNMSFAEERLLSAVVVERDSNGSLGLQITEGSDGNVYIQSVIPGGSASFYKGIMRGDQVIAVNGASLLGRQYSESLELLKSTGQKVEFVLSRIATTFTIQSNETLTARNLSDIKEDDNNTTSCTLKSFNSNRSVPSKTQLGRSSSMESQVEKHTIESCHDLSNSEKYVNRSPVKEHISYQLHYQHSLPRNHNVSFMKNSFSNDNQQCMQRHISKSLSKLSNDNDRAVIVDMIPKRGLDFPMLPLSGHIGVERKPSTLKNDRYDILEDVSAKLSPLIEDSTKEARYLKREPIIAFPRSLGLSRKWKGPVRYPVTPVKKTAEEEVASTSDDEQIFI